MLFSLALFPALAGLAVFALGGSRRTLAVAAGLVLAMTIALAALAWSGGWTGAVEWGGPLHLTARLTSLPGLVAVLVPLIALPVVVYATAHEARLGLVRLISVLLVFVGGMQLLVIADDFLTLLIGWEIVGACSWALIGHKWQDRDNSASALYAFVTTRLGDVGLILTALAVYAATGGFAFTGLAQMQDTGLEVAAAGLVISAAAKSGQVPFAPWLFRAMAGPTSVSALLHAATMVAAGAYALARLQPELAGSALFGPAVIGIGLLTALAGGIVALLQPHAKKLLAASTSAQYGLMFVAVGAGYPGIAILHLAAHAALKALLFLVAGIAGHRADTFDLPSMRFLRALPFAAAASAVGALALAGVPPLGAAWTKEHIGTAAGHVDLLLAAGVLIAGGLSAAYAARFQLSAFGPAAEEDEAPSAYRPSHSELGAAWFLALISLLGSVVWLGSVSKPLGDMLGIAIPKPSMAETVASILLVGLGLLAGYYVVRRLPRLGHEGRVGHAAAWLGLPALIGAGVVRPFERTAELAARADRRLIDGGVRLTAMLVGQLSRGAGRTDRRLLDGGVRLTAALTGWLARATGRAGEFLTDGLPHGAALLTGLAASDARRLQTGLAHHYYTILAIGGAAMAVVLFIGS